MEWEIIPAKKQSTSIWSGGETRELYISPAGSSYDGRDFELRLSSATVTSPTSVFTDLLGYNRELIVLTGSIRLQHNDAPSLFLKELEIDSFDGGARTLSWGACRDFNVMCANKSMCIPEIRAYTNLPEEFEEDQEEMFFYAADGDFIWYYDKEVLQLNKGDLLHICQAGKPFYLRTEAADYKLIQVILKKR